MNACINPWNYCDSQSEPEFMSGTQVQLVPNKDYIRAYGVGNFVEPDAYFVSRLKNPRTLEPVSSDYTKLPTTFVDKSKVDDVITYIGKQLDGYAVMSHKLVSVWKHKRDSRLYYIVDANIYKGGKFHGKQVRMWCNVAGRRASIDAVIVMGTLSEDAMSLLRNDGNCMEMRSLNEKERPLMYTADPVGEVAGYLR